MARDPRDGGTQDLEALSPVTRRLVSANECGDSDVTHPAFLHAVMCQAAMPYRRTRAHLWDHRNGAARLWIEAGTVEDPQTAEIRYVEIPWGAKPRLVLAHLNSEALRQESRYIEVESSLHAFAARVLGYAPNGRQMREMKHHLTALSTATIRLSYPIAGGGRYQTQGQIVSGLELWDHSDGRQRTLWPAEVVFSEDYWKSLSKHAVPLNPKHLAALKHTAMGLDIYAWLGQRLHRIPHNDSLFLPWPRLKDQFGHGYRRLRDFRRVFMRELGQVCSVYPEARVGEELGNDGQPQGLRLQNSKPPVLRRG